MPAGSDVVLQQEGDRDGDRARDRDRETVSRGEPWSEAATGRPVSPEKEDDV